MNEKEKMLKEITSLVLSGWTMRRAIINVVEAHGWIWDETERVFRPIRAYQPDGHIVRM